MMMTLPAKVQTAVFIPMHAGREDRRPIFVPARHHTMCGEISKDF